MQQGVQSANPKEIDDISDTSKLSLAVLEIPPYAKSSFDVKITYDDNKRFTMRDIGKIESLTINLDKAVKLQSIEIANLRSIITNDNGDTLLKSGILVEDFDPNAPLSQTNFFPDLRHVYVLPEAKDVIPAFGQAPPTFTAALTEVSGSSTESKSVSKKVISFLLRIITHHSEKAQQ